MVGGQIILKRWRNKRPWKIIFYMGVLEIEIASMGVGTGGRFSRIGLVAHVHD